MNRKNTILIAVLINAGLLAVLLVAALTMQEENLPIDPAVVAQQEPLVLPSFDDKLPFREPPVSALCEPIHSQEPSLVEPAKPLEIVHPLPPLAVESPSEPLLSASPPPVILAAPTPLLEKIAVKKGDTLEKLARAHHVTVDDIIKANQLKNSFLKIGQVLKIPSKTAPKKSLASGPEYYTMKVGDNPWAVAVKHQMKVEELLRLNGLNEEKARKLKPGDRLRIR